MYWNSYALNQNHDVVGFNDVNCRLNFLVDGVRGVIDCKAYDLEDRL